LLYVVFIVVQIRFEGSGPALLFTFCSGGGVGDVLVLLARVCLIGLSDKKGVDKKGVVSDPVRVLRII